MLLERIVSGGQTGADRAALDVAMALGIQVGGWCPRGRRAEDGKIAARYPLHETPSRAYSPRTEWNVRDSDATLILCCGDMSGGTLLTAQLCKRYERPVLVVDFEIGSDLAKAREWLRGVDAKVLNVAGPREEGAPGIYRKASAFLQALLS